jgi:hypothetical protein
VAKKEMEAEKKTKSVKNLLVEKRSVAGSAEEVSQSLVIVNSSEKGSKKDSKDGFVSGNVDAFDSMQASAEAEGGDAAAAQGKLEAAVNMLAKAPLAK